ncbi:Glutathione S-transferase/chloride channel, C-terminal [Artemisia annua]|uniref:Glutathione S-transferase/chloride channel, C-terminal n=1 Tax=Artemisia annua TaxID=35608 RepID=A0A2U1NCS2_ARTAN|nr:Glutathione S-transferase/chloride channel, C-terminal [Artemisia annua]
MASSSNSNDERKRTIVSALCKSKHLDPTKFLDNVVNDLKSLSINIVKTSLENNDEFNKWVAFAENFPSDPEACSKGLTQLNKHFLEKAVLVGGGYTPSEADVIVFSTVHPYVISLSDSDKKKLPHLLRWMDYIQSTHDLGELFKWIELEKTTFIPPAWVEPEPSSKKAEPDTKKAASNAKATKSGADTEKKSDVPKKQATGNAEAATEKKKLPEKVPDNKDAELSVTLLKIQIGLIRKASKHPSADRLLAYFFFSNCITPLNFTG